MQAGEIGKPLNIYPNAQPPAPAPANPVSLAGATCSLKILNPNTGLTVLKTGLTVSGSDPNPVNHYATYTTDGVTDFPTAGNYTIQLLASYNAGATILKSAETMFMVGASL